MSLEQQYDADFTLAATVKKRIEIKIFGFKK